MGNYNFMLVGVDDYSDKGYPELSSVNNDIDEFEGFVKKYFKYDSLVTYRGVRTKKENLDAAIRNFFLNCNETDTLVLYWSGHGDRIGSDGYLVCSDSKAEDIKDDKISMKEISDVISNSKAEAVLVIVDCCYSGQLARNRKNGAELQIEGKGRVTITASSDEIAFSEGSHGVFTRFLLDELNCLVLLEGYRKIDVTTLYLDVVISMEKANKKQIPNLKAAIQGRFCLEVNNLPFSFPGIPRGRDGFSLNDFNLLEELQRTLKYKVGIDPDHYDKMTTPYLKKELPTGKVEKLIKNPLNNNCFFISTVLYPWVYEGRISFPSAPMIFVDSREQAEEIYEAAIRNEVHVLGVLSRVEHGMVFEKLILRYRNIELEIRGVKSRLPIRKIKLDNTIQWFTYDYDSKKLIILIRNIENYSLGFVSIDNKETESFTNFDFSIDENEQIKIDDIKYFKFSNTCVFETYNKKRNKAVYIYYIDQGVTLKIKDIKKKEHVIPINYENQLVFGGNYIELISYQNKHKYPLDTRWVKEYPQFHDFVSDKKAYFSFYNVLFSLELIDNELKFQKIDDKGSVISVLNEQNAIIKTRDGLYIHNLKTKIGQYIELKDLDKKIFFDNGMYAENEHFGDGFRLNYRSVFTYSGKMHPESLNISSTAKLISVKHTGEAVAALDQGGIINIWE
ncbi:caspase family protein [Paenibacillus sp. 22594]|uniref:caspase family protein n=1 Tax=Paenibacillus sp. 22594 TaxID=3453947 RepID=UPI003F856BD1